MVGDDRIWGLEINGGKVAEVDSSIQSAENWFQKWNVFNVGDNKDRTNV